MSRRSRSGYGRWGGGGYGGFAPYVSVAEKRVRSEKEAAKLTKKGQVLSPVQLDGTTIARSFWGKAWCKNLESYSDFANRMPRGRSYVRNGSVLHLDIQKGKIEALVSGSSLYEVTVKIKPVEKERWATLCRASAGSIASLMELLQGKLSEQVMGIMTHRDSGLFPSPKEIDLDCSCPDWADMCKHVAAVLYGVGARLDEKPELLFLLRHADHLELVSQADSITALTETTTTADMPTLSTDDVGDVFGIEIETAAPAETSHTAPAPRTTHGKTAKKKPRRTAKGKAKVKPAIKTKTKTKKAKPARGKP